MAIILQRIECATAPGAEIRLVEFRRDFCHAKHCGDRLGCLPCAELRARSDVGNAAPRQCCGETLCLLDPDCAEGNIRGPSDQNAIEQVMVAMANKDDRGRHRSMFSTVPAVAFDE